MLVLDSLKVNNEVRDSYVLANSRISCADLTLVARDTESGTLHNVTKNSSIYGVGDDFYITVSELAFRALDYIESVENHVADCRFRVDNPFSTEFSDGSRFVVYPLDNGACVTYDCSITAFGMCNSFVRKVSSSGWVSVTTIYDLIKSIFKFYPSTLDKDMFTLYSSSWYGSQKLVVTVNPKLKTLLTKEFVLCR